jgi:serine/threonine protein kinase
VVKLIVLQLDHSLLSSLEYQVAIKRLKRTFSNWDEIRNLREFRSLHELSSYQHKNIVQLEEVIRETNQQLYFVFEYMPDGNLYEFIKRHTPSRNLLEIESSTPMAHLNKVPVLPDSKIRSITKQILKGLEFLHSKGYIHRDMKPENILMNGNTCKLADFGLARESSCDNDVTDYVSTRWYRAPEVLLRSPNYGKPLDIFGLGCIIAEMYTKCPLFPGQNEIEQIYLITQLLGTPDQSWNEGSLLAMKLGLNLVCDHPKLWSEAIPNIPDDAKVFIIHLLQWNPIDRPTCHQALQSNYFFVEDQSIQSAQTTPNLDRNEYKRKSMIPIFPEYGEPASKSRRLEVTSCPSMYNMFDYAWSFPNLPLVFTLSE